MVRKRWLIGGGLATLALASTLTAGAVFAAPSATPTSTATTVQTKVQTFVSRLASNLGLTSAQVQTGLQKTEDQYVDDAVSSGQITAAQGTALKQKIDSGQLVPFPFDGFGFGMIGAHGHGADMSVVASTLGITTTQLQSDLSSGTTLVQEITNHGKTVTDVVNAIVAQEKTELDQAVTAGKMTQAQETQQLSTLTQQITDAINNNTLGQDGRGFGMFGAHGNGAYMNVVASTLGITTTQLQSDLSSGTTLVQEIANHNKTVTDVVNAIVAQEKTELDQAVTAGKMTQAQETQQLSTLTQQITDAINNNTLFQGGPGGFGHFDGHGPRGGHGGWGQAPSA